MANWILLMKKANFKEIADSFSISPILARLLRNRDLIKEDEINAYLNGDLDSLHDPFLLKDMDRAVAIIVEKIEQGKKIRIIGDYDIDGVNASYILYKGLTRVGVLCDADIPDRIRHGYGINVELVQKAIDDEIDTIITCDNGIAAGEAISYAKENGLTVIVTDHHLVPYEEIDGEKKEMLPPADAVINPHRSDCFYPYKELCGASVAWKFILALYHRYDIPKEEGDAFIEQAAFATIGDVVSLTGENRIIVKEGLRRLPHTKNLGYQALLRACNMANQEILAWHVGFILGPCINASGRLDTAKRSLALLLSSNPEEANRLAGDLKTLNDLRKDETKKAEEQAFRQIEELGYEKDRILVLYLPDCHESIAGIVAGRVREKYGRPAFVLTDSEQSEGEETGKIIKGSGRSVDAYSMFDELVRVKDLLLKFGGHAMAAGLSLEEEKLNHFRDALNENCEKSAEELLPSVRIDMELPLAYATEELLSEMKKLEPFGKDNRKPLFALRNAKVTNAKIVGQNKNVCRFRITDAQGTQMDGISFTEPQRLMDLIQKKNGVLHLLYYPDLNEFRGEKNMQAVISDYQ